MKAQRAETAQGQGSYNVAGFSILIIENKLILVTFA